MHPRDNPDLLGHEAAEAMLLGTHRSGRLPHAWLLTGPNGIGKATLAYRFARFLLARGGTGATTELFDDADPGLYVAPDEPVFRRVAAGGHADLCTIERNASEPKGRVSPVIRVGQIRELVRFFTLTSAEGGWRIAVVDEASDMNTNAANALLKVLEEPPQGALLLLVSDAPSRLPATIRSRCRRLPLRPLPAERVAEVVAMHLPVLASAERDSLAGLAAGSPGRALALAEQGGLDVYRELVGLLQSLPRLDYPKLHALGDRLARRDGEAAYRVWLDLIRLWLYRLILAGTGRRGNEVVAGEDQVSEQLLDGGGLDRWLELWEKVNRLVARADSVHLDRKQVVLSAFLALEATARG